MASPPPGGGFAQPRLPSNGRSLPLEGVLRNCAVAARRHKSHPARHEALRTGPRRQWVILVLPGDGRRTVARGSARSVETNSGLGLRSRRHIVLDDFPGQYGSKATALIVCLAG